MSGPAPGGVSAYLLLVNDSLEEHHGAWQGMAGHWQACQDDGSWVNGSYHGGFEPIKVGRHAVPSSASRLLSAA